MLEHGGADVTLFFPQGLPGFENQRWFAVAEPASLCPFVCLRSLELDGLSFWAAPISAIDPDYALEIRRLATIT